MSGRDEQVVAFIVVVLVFSIAPIIVAARLAERRGRNVWFGIGLAFLLGWFGVVAVLLSRRQKGGAAAAVRMRSCPSCGAPVGATVATCAGCGVASTPWTLHGGHWWARDESGEWRYLDDARNAWVSPSDGTTLVADVPAPAAGSAVPATGSTRPAVASAGVTVFVGIDHVQVAAPPDREFDARRFYGGLLGLPEIDRPVALASRGGCWFQAGAHALHVGVAADFQPATKAHPAFRLRSRPDLVEVAERLEAAGYEIEWADEAEIPGVLRFHVHDPFGNRVELLA